MYAPNKLAAYVIGVRGRVLTATCRWAEWPRGVARIPNFFCIIRISVELQLWRKCEYKTTLKEALALRASANISASPEEGEVRRLWKSRELNGWQLQQRVTRSEKGTLHYVLTSNLVIFRSRARRKPDCLNHEFCELRRHLRWKRRPS